MFGVDRLMKVENNSQNRKIFSQEEPNIPNALIRLLKTNLVDLNLCKSGFKVGAKSGRTPISR